MPVALRRNIAWPALAALLALLAAAAPASAVAHGEGAIVFEGTDGAFEVTVRSPASTRPPPEGPSTSPSRPSTRIPRP